MKNIYDPSLRRRNRYALLATCALAIAGLLCARPAHAQTPMPLDFFPHEVGDAWEYTNSATGKVETTITIVGDTVNAAGDTLIAYDVVDRGAPKPTRNWYRLDSMLQVFAPSAPDSSSSYLLYRLDAKVGDEWRVRTADTVTWAKVTGLYGTSVFGDTTTAMKIQYYIKGGNWFEIQTMAAGIGVVFIESNPFRYRYLTGALLHGRNLGSRAGVERPVTGAATSGLRSAPNPFAGGTTFGYTVRTAGYVRLVVTDLVGREVVRLVDGMQEEGAYSSPLDGTALPAGVYLVRLSVDGATSSMVVRRQ